ncbi:MAG TPA: hypothetical protein ENH49_00605 [Candidatus Marinimicrobia bacterium]|nr:hypothetical protein [Candidatus Neomarinimicrobiota bacterium]
MSFGTHTPRFYPVQGGDDRPSVTTILSVLDKPALVPWAARVTAEYIQSHIDDCFDADEIYELCNTAKNDFRAVSQTACDIGTAVHRAVELSLKQTGIDEAVETALDETGIKKPDDVERVWNGTGAFHKWEKDHGVTPLALEVRMDNAELGYAGRVDFVGYVNGKLTLIDFKTSKAFYPEYAMQTAAYRDCEPETGDFHPADIVANGVLRLDKNTGKPHYKDYSEFYEYDLDMFQLLCRFYHLQMERKRVAKERRAK